jgi:hypothetical protein
MKTEFVARLGVLMLIHLLGLSQVRGQLVLLPGQRAQRVFAGEGRKISVIWNNPAEKPIEVLIRTRLHQVSSATTITLGDSPWKRLQVLPGQTIIEEATFDFPTVKSETHFLIQWVQGANQVLGTTEVLAYPPDLLKQLIVPGREGTVGVYDPQNQLKPLLKLVSLDYVDLEQADIGGFSAKLAIIGPFLSKAQISEGLANKLKHIAQNGATVLWIQPPPTDREGLKPSFHLEHEGKGAMVVVQPSLVADLSENPESQLHLLELARSVFPENPHLPNRTMER